MIFKAQVYGHDSEGCCYVFVLCVNLVMAEGIISVKLVYNFTGNSSSISLFLSIEYYVN